MNSTPSIRSSEMHGTLRSSFRKFVQPRERYISLQDSTQLKGFAILIMLYLHIIVRTDICATTSEWALITLGGKSLSQWLWNFCAICVQMYILLSGYGLWIVSRRSAPMRNVRRVLHLLLLVALVGIVFLPWGPLCFHKPWTFTPLTILFNLIGYRTYNAEWWFLFPWIVLCLCSRWIFSACSRFGMMRVLAVALVLFLVCRFTIYYVGEDVISRSPYRIIYFLLVTISLSLPFLLGAAAAHYGWFASFKALRGRLRLWALVGLVLLICVRTFLIPVGIFDSFVSLFFCFGLCALPSSRIMTGLGKVNAEMWLTHTFFCTYYFESWFVSLGHPWLMFPVLIIVTYLSSWVLHQIYRWLLRVVP